jgi:hypothetical protein
MLPLQRFSTGKAPSYYSTPLHEMLGKRTKARINPLSLKKVQAKFDEDPGAVEVQAGLGRIVALHHRSSTSYQIH